MLDTNIVSHIIREHPKVTRRMLDVPMDSLCISAITAGELYFGLAKRPAAKRLQIVVGEFLKCVDILPWCKTIAEQYGDVRAEMEKLGKIIAPLDLLIASHALSSDKVLVTNDQAFAQVTRLQIEDWTD